MLFLFRSAPEVEKRIHSKLFRKFWMSRGIKEPAYITLLLCLHFQKRKNMWIPKYQYSNKGFFKVQGEQSERVLAVILSAVCVRCMYVL